MTLEKLKFKLENQDENVKILKSNGKREKTKLVTNQTVNVDKSLCIFIIIHDTAIIKRLRSMLHVVISLVNKYRVRHETGLI